jgi:signal transduction histidine kinase
MDRASITSGYAFQTAVRATAILLAVMVLSSITVYFYIQREMIRSLQDEIGEDRLVLEQAYKNGGAFAMIDAIAALNDPLHKRTHVVGLFDAKSAKVVGNIDSKPAQLGWSEQSYPSISDTSAFHAEFYVYQADLDGFSLVVGRSLALVKLQQSRMILALVVMGLAVSAAFLLLGYGGSLQSLRRLERMGETLERVSTGDSAARLLISPQNDQFDRVAWAMNRHLDRLSTLMQTTKANAAAIAHDLRTPLSRAFLLMDRVQRLQDAGGDPRELIDEVEAELVRLNSIIEAILRISRLESAEAGEMGEVSLAPLLADLAETFAALAEERGQTLSLTPVREALTLRADAAMVAQLLANLLQNAITHCPPGAAIGFGAEARGGGLCLWVSDNGPGIAEAEREKVFNLFYRIDANRTGGGNGLGMALVKAIAERLGAKIVLGDAASGEAAPGLRVEVSFPAKA